METRQHVLLSAMTSDMFIPSFAKNPHGCSQGEIQAVVKSYIFLCDVLMFSFYITADARLMIKIDAKYIKRWFSNGFVWICICSFLSLWFLSCFLSLPKRQVVLEADKLPAILIKRFANPLPCFLPIS